MKTGFKELVKFDTQVSMMVALNWALIMAVWVLLANTVPKWAFYTIGIVELLLYEYSKILNSKTDMIQALWLIIIYENVYTFILVICWFSFNMSVELAAFLLMSGKAFGVLGKNVGRKFENMLNLYYQKKAPWVQAILQKYQTRASAAGLLLGVGLSQLGLDAILIVFALLQTYSLVLGIRCVKVYSKYFQENKKAQ
jgi:hypothetical protein